tara:strand:- start:165 stop:971 length:807 start_codon:yes stop_codon:yes gene_type:complete
MRLLALFGVVVLVSLSGTNDWFLINGEGKYVEGIVREPTIIVNYTVNSTEEVIDLEIQNYTPLRTYWRNREPVPTPVLEYSSEEIESMKIEGEESNFDLDKSRSIMSILFGAMMIIQIINLLVPNMKIYFPFIVWLLGLIGFLIIVPLGVISSFGVDGPTGGFSDETETSDFAHMEIDSGVELDLNSIKFTFDTLGFDLGLIPLEEHETVKQTPPQEGEENYDALIGFSGFIELEFSDGLKNWLCIPLIWVVFIFVNKKIVRNNLEEE